MCEKR
ncbi:Protein of unknown function [Pyronema omphalodes CBS 100304]